MFGIGVPEFAIIAVVAVFVFGPDRLPGLARQAGGFVRTSKQLIDNAKSDLADQMGDDFAGLKDLDLKSMSPRELVKRNLFDVGEPDFDPDRVPPRHRDEAAGTDRRAPGDSDPT